MKKFLVIFILATNIQAFADQNPLGMMTEVVKFLGISKEKENFKLLELKGHWKNPPHSYDQSCKLMLEMTTENILIWPVGANYGEFVKQDIFGLGYDPKTMLVTVLMQYQGVRDTIFQVDSSTVVFSREQERDYFNHYFKRSLKLELSGSKIVRFELSDKSGGYENAVCEIEN